MRASIKTASGNYWHSLLASKGRGLSQQCGGKPYCESELPATSGVAGRRCRFEPNMRDGGRDPFRAFLESIELGRVRP